MAPAADNQQQSASPPSLRSRSVAQRSMSAARVAIKVANGLRIPKLSKQKLTRTADQAFLAFQAELQGLVEKPSSKLPGLSLENPPTGMSVLHLHNVGLMRWVFEEAKIAHTARPSYQARQDDSSKGKVKFMPGVIFREVCSDVLSSTKKCCKAYRMMNMPIAVTPSQASLSQRVQKLRRKVFVAVALKKVLRQVREENANAELMWKQCCAGLGSMTVNNQLFASRSLGLKSLHGGPRLMCASGSISLGLRKMRRGAAAVQGYDGSSDFPAPSGRAGLHLPSLSHAPDLMLQPVDAA